MSTWENWSRLERATPAETHAPRDAEQVAGLVRRAAEQGRRIKMVGTGHSFTPIAVPVDVLLDPRQLTGVTAVDRDSMTVTVLAGTPLKVLNRELEWRGLSLHNMGDIAEQTVSGAISTGTHGSGGTVAGLAAQVAALDLVDGRGERRHLGPDDPHIDAARLGLGALGVITAVTFLVEPMFLLEAHERAAAWAEAFDDYDGLTTRHHHVDIHWFPHTDRLLLKTNDRLADPVEAAEPLPPWRARLEQDVLENAVFGAAVAGLKRFPDPPRGRTG